MFEKIQAIIADALFIDVSEVAHNANLMRDLGAESIDFLDIIFRLEKAFDVKIPRGEMEQRARGALSEEEFAINGLIQPKGLKSLHQTMPEIDADLIRTGLYVRDIPSLFTVATFERMITEQLHGTTTPYAVPSHDATTAAYSA